MHKAPKSEVETIITRDKTRLLLWALFVGFRFLLGEPIYLAILQRICSWRVEGNDLLKEINFLNVQFFSEKGNPLIKSWGKSSQKRTCAFEFAKEILLFGDSVLKHLLTSVNIFSIFPELRRKALLITIGSAMMLARTQDCICAHSGDRERMQETKWNEMQ